MSQSKASSRNQKRARFSNKTKKRPFRLSPTVLIVGVVAILGLVGVTVAILSRPAPSVAGTAADAAGSSPVGKLAAATVGHAPFPLVAAEDGVVRLPLSTFEDNQAHFFTYLHNGQPIEFFALKSNDGVVRAAFNACDVCFGAKKGYHQEGDVMVCNNCGQRFASNLINEVRGGCNPSPLERTVEGDTLIINVEDVISGQTYF